MKSNNPSLNFILKFNRLFDFRTSILHWILIFPVLSTNSQDIHNGGSIYISGEAMIHMPASFINDGFIENNGKVSINGNWDNRKIYQGLGSVALGGADQSIHNNDQPIHELSIAGGGIKSVLGKVAIGQTLYLNDGVVTTTYGDTLLISDNAAINGGSASSYIDGALFAAGTGYKYFPLGKDGVFLPAELLDVKGIDPVVSMSLTTIPESQAVNNVTGIFPHGWLRTDVRGYFEKSAIALALPDQMAAENLVILQSNNESNFSIIDDVEITAENELFRAIVTDLELKGKLFAIGHSSVTNGEEDQYYLSTTLSPGAAKPENRFVKLFGNALNAEGFLFQVYDRWGKTIFETRSPEFLSTQGWDGKSNLTGQPLPTGAYPFILKATDISGTNVTSRGVITIIYQ